MTSNQDQHVNSQQSGTTATVVVTGASKGIGAAIVRRLAADGFRIIAGVRRTEDAEALRGQVGERVVPALLDITDPDAVAAAAELVGGEVGERGRLGWSTMPGSRWPRRWSSCPRLSWAASWR